jgi:peptide/nickel transport system permease protein
MLRYTLWRLLALIPTLLIISLVAFAIMRIVPGSAASALMGLETNAEYSAALDAAYGLNQPLPLQYLQWLQGLMHGDLGNSPFLQQSVSAAILEHLGPTLCLAFFAQLIALLIALPCGILAAWRQGGIADILLRISSLAGVAMPGFLVGLLLMLCFGKYLRLLPVAGYVPFVRDPVEFIRHLVLPAVSLGLVQAALILRMTRASMLQALALDCVRTARAKGAPERVVLWKHALRAAVLPVLTAVGQSFGSLITGAVIIETIFNIPGMGQLVMHAIVLRDVMVVQSVLLVLTLLYAGVNLCVDLLYAVADPRLRAHGQGSRGGQKLTGSRLGGGFCSQAARARADGVQRVDE